VGSGFKTFSPGNVLTASDVNNYFMEQAVMSFADSAARTSQIGTANFEEGMLSYLQDTDRYEAYNGTAWVALGTLAGDTGGLVHIKTVDSGGAVSSFSVDNAFSAEFRNYKVFMNWNMSSNVANNIRLRVSGSDNSTANSYVLQTIQANGTTLEGARNTSNLLAGAVIASSGLKNGTEMTIYNPFLTVQTVFAIHNANSLSGALIRVTSGTHNQTVSYDGFSIIPDSGTMTIDKLSVYGIKEG
jgi:hypothetical protein